MPVSLAVACSARPAIATERLDIEQPPALLQSASGASIPRLHALEAEGLAESTEGRLLAEGCTMCRGENERQAQPSDPRRPSSDHANLVTIMALKTPDVNALPASQLSSALESIPNAVCLGQPSNPTHTHSSLLTGSTNNAEMVDPLVMMGALRALIGFGMDDSAQATVMAGCCGSCRAGNRAAVSDLFPAPTTTSCAALLDRSASSAGEAIHVNTTALVHEAYLRLCGI